MRFALEILIIGLIFNSGYTIPAPASDDLDYPADDVPKPKGNPVITSHPLEITPRFGETVVLPCRVENNTGEDSVTWSLNNANTTLYMDSLAVVATNVTYTVDSDHSLHIKNFSADLYGKYICAIPQFQLTLVHALMPKERVVIESVNGKKVVENLSELSLTCRTIGFPSPTISWSRKSSENSVETDLNSKSATFVIPRATFSDTGIYTCKANNGESSDAKSVPVLVVNGVAPESAKVYPSEAENSTKLCCVFDYSRIIVWLKDGKLIPSSDRFSTSVEKHKNCLMIKKAKVEDIGTYTCQTEKNPQEHAEVELSGSPASAFVKHISPDDSKNPTVTWIVTSLAPISEYKVFARRADEPEWIEFYRKEVTDQDKMDKISYTFSNLKNGRYSVKLEVTNKYGSSEFIENGGVVVEKINSGADSHFRVSSLCVLFVILMRLWSC